MVVVTFSAHFHQKWSTFTGSLHAQIKSLKTSVSSALTFWDAVLGVGNVASFRSKRTQCFLVTTLAVCVFFPDGDDSHTSVPLSLLQQVDFTSSPVKSSLTAGATAAGLCLIPPPVRLYYAVWQWRHWVRKLLSIHGAGGLSRFKAHVGVLTMQKLLVFSWLGVLIIIHLFLRSQQVNVRHPKFDTSNSFHSCTVLFVHIKGPYMSNLSLKPFYKPIRWNYKHGYT